jgi:hypothetical protein
LVIRAELRRIDATIRTQHLRGRATEQSDLLVAVGIRVGDNPVGDPVERFDQIARLPAHVVRRRQMFGANDTFDPREPGCHGGLPRSFRVARLDVNQIDPFAPQQR